MNLDEDILYNSRNYEGEEVSPLFFAALTLSVSGMIFIYFYFVQKLCCASEQENQIVVIDFGCSSQRHDYEAHVNPIKICDELSDDMV